MEDLWKVGDIKYRLNDMADRAEYDRLIKSFHAEEQESHRRELLYGSETVPPKSKTDK